MTKSEVVEIIVEALEIPTTSNQTIPTPDEEIRQTLIERNHPGCLVGNANRDPEIDVLIKADFYCSLGTENLKSLGGNLRADETHLEWTVQEQLPNPTKT